MRVPLRPKGWGSAGLVWLLGLVWTAVVAGGELEELQVRTEVASGPHFVGEGFELRVGVAAAGQRPDVELPRVAGAEVWVVGTDLKPISASGIGAVTAQAN